MNQTGTAGIDARKRWAIMGAVMLGLFLSAMDQTIVGTAMPRIITDLHGLELYSWVVTSYILCSTTAVPIVGKLGDTYGRKPFFIAGVIVFLGGSALCGAAQSMTQLIVFRGVQGIGGGMIFANAFAIVADLFSPMERGRYMGLMSGVFGLASVIGPLVGGWITDNIDWRWVFYVNLPVGVVALPVLALVLPPSARGTERKPVDYAGGALLVTTIVPMLLAFSWAGSDYAWTSPQVTVPLALSLVFGAAFIFVERRAEDPMIPLHLFGNRVFAVATVVTFISGAAMFSGMVYIPLFMQGVLDFSATNAGLIMTPMTLGMVAGSIMGGQAISRTGRYRWQAVIGLVVSTGGLFMLSQLTTESSQVTGMTAMCIMGIGLGVSFPVFVLATQNALPSAYVGVSTSLNQFARSVGSTIGVAVLGSVMTRQLNDGLAQRLPPEVQERAPSALLDAVKNPRLDDAALVRLRDEGFGATFGADGPRLFDASMDAMRHALATSITDVLAIATIVMALAVVIALFLQEIPLRRSYETPEAPAAAEPPRAPAPVATAAQPVAIRRTGAPAPGARGDTS